MKFHLNRLSEIDPQFCYKFNEKAPHPGTRRENNEKNENRAKKVKSDPESPENIGKKLDQIGHSTNDMPDFVKGPAKQKLQKTVCQACKGKIDSGSLDKAIHEIATDGSPTEQPGQSKEGQEKPPEALSKAQKEEIKKYLEAKLKEVENLKKKYEQYRTKGEIDKNDPGEIEMEKRFQKAKTSFNSALSDVNNFPEKEGAESNSNQSDAVATGKEALGKKEGAEVDAWLRSKGVEWNSAKDPWCAVFISASTGTDVTNGVQAGALNLPKAAGGKEIAMSEVKGKATLSGNSSNTVRSGRVEGFTKAYELKDGTKVVTKERGDPGSGKGHIEMVDEGGEAGEATTSMA